jgi:hypothetical protein
MLKNSFSLLLFGLLDISYLVYLGNKYCLNVLVVIGFLHVMARHYFNFKEHVPHEK